MMARIVVAAMVALVAGFGGAAVGARFGWGLGPDFPSGQALDQVMAPVLGGAPAFVEREPGVVTDFRAGRSVADRILRGYDEEMHYSTLTFGPDPGELRVPQFPGSYQAWTDRTVELLRADGWDVDSVTPMGATVIATGALDQDGTRITAHRDGLGLRIDTSVNVVGVVPGSFHVDARLTRALPWAAILLGPAGLLVGAAVGLLALRQVRRRTRDAPALRRVAGVLTGVALVLLVPQALAGLVGFVGEAGRTADASAPFWSLSVTWFHLAALIGTLALVTAGLMAAAPKVSN